MTHGARMVTMFLIISVVIGIAATFILYHLFGIFFGGDPGQQVAVFAAPFMGTGIACGAVTLMLLYYPVVKKGVKVTDVGEDFR